MREEEILNFYISPTNSIVVSTTKNKENQKITLPICLSGKVTIISLFDFD